MNTSSELVDLRDARPTVYLDLWVWIRLASAAAGRPRERFDLQLLTAVQDASAAGVAFPISETHHVEVSKIADPQQRDALARTMLSVSRFCTLRSRRVLVRHQFLQAMHARLGRPTFRPTPPRVLGTGALWASRGEEAPLTLRDSKGRMVDPDVIPGGASFVRAANQWAEFKLLAGPQDAEVADLRRHGYRPEEVAKVIAGRVDWEAEYKEILASGPISRDELRVRVQAREMTHEYLTLISKLCNEYHLDLNRAVGGDPDRPGSGRAGIVAFSDHIPTMRIAVDLKVELFRARKPWTSNAVHDIDALSGAVPYCHVVVPDGEMADFLSRSKVQRRIGTRIIHKVPQLLDVLTDLTDEAVAADLDPEHGQLARPGEKICFEEADLHAVALRNSRRGAESQIG
ncbi:hypothetical protein ACFV13_10305 [Streptomyces bauhiniae]|uniref:hypothetical protein n=1 Tax=Streptomyces bauhiniae TaxID=2340725 RepID=UPI003676DCB2